MTSLISPSGGVVYHFRAWKYHSKTWRPFRESLGSWLRDHWSPPKDRPLLLIGPSAGWCLPLEFLRSYPKVIARDLDPLALWILKKRFKSPQLKISAGDGLGICDPKPGESLRVLLGDPELKDASVLFCNLWGQLYFEDSYESQLPFWKQELETLLEGRTWASFYDRVSGSLRPEINASNARSDAGLSDSEILASFYQNTNQNGAAVVELQDHATSDYFKKMPRHFLRWELEPGRYHLIEAIQSSP